MEGEILKIISFLPSYEELKHIFTNQNEADNILSMACKNIQKIQQDYEKSHQIDVLMPEIEETSYLIVALIDQFWEHIHTGIFSEVPLDTRRIYTISCYFKIAFNLISSHDQLQLEICNEILDEALLLGWHNGIYHNGDRFKNSIMEFLNTNLVDASLLIKLPNIEPIEHKDLPCDIDILQSPTVEDFNEKHFIPLKPALLRDIINDWPALSKWRDMSYILKIAGNRTVPIEIGTNYTTDDWGQQLMKIRDFLKRQFAESSPTDDDLEVEYLAQHELFNHVPVLKEDIRTPSYCCLGNEPDKIDIKAWLGPKGTISPMHQDPKHNILCQVFGTKRVVLASPDDSKYLYPHDHEFFKNTSQLDPENLDLIKFPLASNVKFYHLTLQEGECLYLPPKWWHYIRSEAKSFSMSGMYSCGIKAISSSARQ